MLNKNFIRFNYFDYVFSILIVKKLKNEFKICVDYKILNVFTIKIETRRRSFAKF